MDNKGIIKIDSTIISAIILAAVSIITTLIAVYKPDISTFIIVLLVIIIGLFLIILTIGILRNYRKAVEKPSKKKKITLFISISVYLASVVIIILPHIRPSITIGSFDMKPYSERIFNIFLDSEGFRAGKNITFLFSNGNCKESSEYLVKLKWGPFISEELHIPCNEGNNYKDIKYFTGFGGGDIELEVVFISDNADINGANVKIIHGNEGNKIKWHEK